MTLLDSVSTFAAPRTIPWLKLCGVRDLPTAVALAELRPDALGLNFYEPSSRYVSRSTAAEIVQALPSEIMPVGLFVNASLDDILKTIDQVGLAAVQLHGDEPPAFLTELRARTPVALIRALRVGDEGLASVSAYLAACATLGVHPDALLIDAKVAGSYGGTGVTAPWHLLRDYDLAWPPLILAGGLTPANVASAIATVRPWGVDTAGGVESSPGLKDPALARQFLSAARGTVPDRIESP